MVRKLVQDIAPQDATSCPGLSHSHGLAAVSFPSIFLNSAALWQFFQCTLHINTQPHTPLPTPRVMLFYFIVACLFSSNFLSSLSLHYLYTHQTFLCSSHSSLLHLIYFYVSAPFRLSYSVILHSSAHGVHHGACHAHRHRAWRLS